MILQDLFESKMSELDIEYQDFLNSRGKKSITDKEFQDAYGMSRTDWAKKNKEWTWQKERRLVAPDAHLFHEGAMKDLHTELAEKYRELAPKIEKYKDSYLAGELYDALEEIAERHGAMKEFRSMLNGARNRAHMDYDTNPGGFQNWFWYLPFADDLEEGIKSWMRNKLDPNNIPGFKEVYPEVKNYVIKDMVTKFPKDKFGRPNDSIYQFEMGEKDKEILDSIQDYFIQKLGNVDAYKFLNGNRKLLSGLIRQLQVDITIEIMDIQKQYVNEKQDACYRKVKSRYKVWPSAYASGALVQCRKKGAANWGNKSKK